MTEAWPEPTAEASSGPGPGRASPSADGAAEEPLPPSPEGQPTVGRPTAGRRWWADRRLRSLAVGLAAAGLLAFLLFGVIGTGPGGSSGQVVPVGAVAPDFELPALGGGPPVHLAALGRDRHRPVVLNFFASWCVPCREETPLLASVARAEARRGSPVQFVGVDVGDVPSSARAFVQQAGVEYPVAVDANLSVTAGRYGLNGEPQTFFLDPEGRVVAHKLGALHRAELKADIQRATGT